MICPSCGRSNGSSVVGCACGGGAPAGATPFSSLAAAEQAEESAQQARSAQEIGPAQDSSAGSDMLFGALWCLGGILVTALSYQAASPGGTYIVAWGAILFGGFQFLRGLVNAGRGE